MLAKLDAHHKRMMARMVSLLEKMEAAVKFFEERLKKMDITDLEADQEMFEAVVKAAGHP
jgi:carbamate kinase